MNRSTTKISRLKRRRRSTMVPNMKTHYQTDVITALKVYKARFENGLKTSITPDEANTSGGQQELSKIIFNSLCMYCEALCSVMNETREAHASRGSEGERICRVK